jgi:serine/threonine protein kinase/WD40 repeat protein/Flp pilus assembly protein TadD
MDGLLDPLDSLAEEFVERYRRGEHPAVSEYEGRHPELAGRIRQLFPALVELECVGGGPSPPRFRWPASGRIGEFRLLREIGAGGMGVVYEAAQESLGRRVALKILPDRGDLASPERFVREARTAARLHHTNIVPVFSVGEADGVHFYAMQFIDGPSLAQVLQAARFSEEASSGPKTEVLPEMTALDRSGLGTVTPQKAEASSDWLAWPTGADRSGGGAFRALAGQAARVASALAYAHEQGVLHRDIKPSNILIDSTGTPWIVDFGLAKSSGDGDLTGTGDMLGTLRYMAPERFRGRADFRSDVYSLGATLYEMLTIRPAYDSPDRLALVDAICRGQFPRPRSVDPRIPRDLETICLKAMAREPGDRYATARELADDLERFLIDRPIRARRATLADRARRWWRRDRAVASLTLAVGLLLIALAAGSAVFAVWAERARFAAVELGEQARRAERQRSGQLVRSLADRAHAGRSSRRPGQRFESLDAIREAVPLARALGETPEFFDRLRAQAIACMALPDIRFGRPGGWNFRPETTYRLDPGFRRFASAGPDGRIRAGQVDDSGAVVELDGHPGEQAFGLGAGGLVVAARSMSGGVRAWDLRGKSPALILDRAAGVAAVDVRPDGREIALGLSDGTVSILETGRPEAERRAWSLGRPPNHLAYAPDGRSLAVADSAAIAIIDATTGRLTATFARSSPAVAIAWDPRGGHLAVADVEGRIAVLDVRRREVIQTCDGRSGGARIDFTPDGSMISSIAWDGLWRLHDAGGGKQRLVASLAGGRQFGRGDRLLAGPTEDELGLAEVATGSECRTLLRAGREDDRIGGIAAHPGGRLLAVARTRWVGLWDLSDGRLVGELPIPCRRLTFSGGGDLLTHGEGGLHLWPLAIGGDGSVVVGPPTLLTDRAPGGVMAVASSGDGRIVAATFEAGLGVLDREQPGRTTWLGPQSDVRIVAVSPDGRLVAAASWHGGQGVRVYESSTGRPVARIAVSEGMAASFSPDGRWLLVGSERSRQLWRTTDWSPGPVIGGICHTFNGDGSLLATASAEGLIRLLRPETGVELARFEPPDPERIYELAFAPDGTRLTVSCAVEDWLYTWDLRAVRRQLVGLDLDWDAPPLPDAGPEPPLTLAVAEAPAGPFRTWLGEELRAWARLRRQGPSAGVYEDRARSSMRRKAFDLALADIDRALALQPDRADLHYRRGQILMRHRRDLSAAAEAFARAVAADPLWREARVGFLSAKVAAGEAQSALADIERDVADRPWETSARGLLGRALAKSGRPGEAVAELTTALAASPSSLRLRRWRAEAYDALGETDRAKADRPAPPPPFEANQLAWVLIAGSIDTRDPEAAFPLAKGAVASAPDNRTMHNTLGLAHARLGRPAEAIPEFRASLQGGDGRSDAFDLYHLAICRSRLGDRLGGWSDFARGLAWHVEHASTITPSEREELADFLVEALDVLLGLSSRR